DLSDWPTNARWYALEMPGVGTRPTPEDFRGRFALGYNEGEQALYFAIEVEDDSIVPEPIPGRQDNWWEAADGCEIYIDLAHGEDTRAIQYALYGEKPSTAYVGGVIVAGWKGVEFDVQREAGKHVYEWRVDIGQIAEGAGVRLRADTSIGLDVSAVDRDADGSFSWMAWGEGVVKVSSTANRGDAILAGRATGTLLGRVDRAAGTGSLAHRSVRVQNTDEESLWLMAKSDRQGRFAVELPAGRYQLSATETLDTVTVAVAAGAIVEVAQQIAPAIGRKTVAGPGRKVVAGPGTRSGFWQHFGVADGLGGGRILHAIQDSRGHLWMATNGGLSRYDGRHFTTFSREDGLPANMILSVAEDRLGHIWLGTLQSGAVRYDGEYFTHFTLRDGLGANQIMDIEVDAQGNVWLATFGGGAARFDGQYFERFTTRDGLGNNTLVDIHQGPDGTLWFGTEGGGVSRYDGEVFTTFTTADGLVDDFVNSVASDTRGNMWFGTHSGLSRYDGEVFANFTTANGLAYPKVHGIGVDRMDRVWAATFGGGLSVLDGDAPIKTFTTADGLASNALYTVFEDREGNIWLGTEGVGLVRYGGSPFRTFMPAEGLVNDQVLTLLRARDGEVWVGTTRGGVLRCTTRGCRSFALPGDVGHYNYNILDILQDRRGRLYFASQKGGLCRYDGERFTVFNAENSLIGNSIYQLYEDREGGLWVSTGIGLMHYDGEVWRRVGEGIAALRGSSSAIWQDSRGHMWFSAVTPDNKGLGVTRYDGENWRTFSVEDGLAHDNVHAILEDHQGHMWFGTDDGLSRYDGKTWRTFSVEEGLANGRVMALMEDERGQLWIGTRAGLSRYDGHTIQNMTRADGLASDDVRVMAQDGEGGYWLGGIGGLVRYQPQESTPSVQMLDVVGDRRYGPVAKLQLPTTENYLAFEFYGTSFKTRPGELVYRHRLLGLDEQWINSKEERVEYFDLPMGNYTFEVEAVDRDLGYSLEPLRVQVEIHFPYRQTGLWISLSLGLGMLGLAAGRVYQRRQMRLRVAEERSAVLEQANEKLREADQLKSDFVAHVSHELRTPLTAIKGAVGNMLDGITGEYDERQTRYLNRLENNADQLSALIEDLLDLSRIEAGQLRLMPENVDMAAVCRSVLEGLMGLAERRGIALRMAEVSGAVEVVADADRVRQVLVNLLGNALKFTPSGGEVVLGVERVEAEVRVWVRDTGEGIPAAELGRVFEKFHQARNGLEQGVRGAGIGLSIARQLVELHGGRIWVESEEGMGSTFIFALPDKKAGER
ncbi:MAG: two-component system sensor histidine kinase ChiS, partial [Candidatus Latescibacterota bacterium]